MMQVPRTLVRLRGNDGMRKVLSQCRPFRCWGTCNDRHKMSNFIVLPQPQGRADFTNFFIFPIAAIIFHCHYRTWMHAIQAQITL